MPANAHIGRKCRNPLKIGSRAKKSNCDNRDFP